MVDETIQAIRQTEAKAEAMTKDAEVKCRQIIEGASKKAGELRAGRLKDARDKAASLMEEVKRQGEVSADKALLEVENKIKELKEAAARKEKEAVGLVISKLI